MTSQRPWILGLDPGLAHFGIAAMPVGEMALMHCRVVVTEKGKGKCYVSADNMRRVREVSVALLDVIGTFGPPVAVCAEAMSHPQQASAAAKMSMTRGTVGMLCAVWDLPYVERTPQQIKKHLCGNRGASKADVQDALKPNDPDELLQFITKSKREHAADAAGAIVASWDDVVLRMARRVSG